MVDRSLAAAFIGAGGVRHRVLGVSLVRPFCSWHQLLLQTVDSPFLRKGDVRLFDLRNAVGVCQLGFEETEIRRPLAFIPRFRRKAREEWLVREAGRFLDYTGDYITRPEFAIIPKQVRDDGPPDPAPPNLTPIPELIRTVGEVIAWSGWPEHFVWELPLSRLHWYQLVALREKGVSVSYLDEEEREFQAALKADREAKANGERPQ